MAVHIVGGSYVEIHIVSGVLGVRGCSPAPADAVRVRVNYFREFEQFTLWANHCCKTDIALCHILSFSGGRVG